MLVLTRKIGEVIVIGDDIRIMVLAIQGGKVRIGIAAPDDISVDRQEIHEKRKELDHMPPAPTNLVGAV